jgi:phosphodiesterase/alkaline phosphatase D-like protein
MGASPPTFEKELKEEAVYSTRAHIAVEMFTGELPTEWVSEYCNGKDGTCTEGEGNWVKSAEGEAQLDVKGVLPFQEVDFLGKESGAFLYPHRTALIRNLEPSTIYYARFKAKNSAGSATSVIFNFTTNPIKKPEFTEYQIDTTSPETAAARAIVETNGAQTEYHFEYAPADSQGNAPPEGSLSWTLFTEGGAGTITVAEDFAIVEPKITGLAPEKKYFARVTMSNSQGTVLEGARPRGRPDGSFETPTAKPIVNEPNIRNVTGTSVYISSRVLPHHSETLWRLEYATTEGGHVPSGNSPLWTEVPGAKGIVTQSQAEALAEGVDVSVASPLSGLEPMTTYYVRLFAENAAGEGLTCHENTICEPIRSTTHGLTSFQTFGAPIVKTFAVHGLHGEALRVMGAVNPDSVATSGEQTVTLGGNPTGGTFTLTFKGQTTGPIAFDAPGVGSKDSVDAAVGALSSVGGDVEVTGPDGGPYSVYFTGKNGGVAQPLISGDGSGLTPGGTVTVTTVLAGGEAYDTHYHFEYVSQKQFEAPGGEGGFAKAGSTEEVDLGSGDSDVYVGADLSGLTPGESYMFRTVATNTSPGNPVVNGGEQSLSVPVLPVSGPEEAVACGKERKGASAHLPDCRAYEQLTPTDKGGAQEIFSYGGNAGREGARPGSDGDHFEYGSVPVKWGSGVTAGQSPYFFSRSGDNWSVIGATAQPTAGVFRYTPQVFSSDLTRFAFEARWATSPSLSSESPHVEYMVGTPGGPYTTVESVSRAQAEPGWVAGSADLSKVVLEVTAHALLGKPTGTKEGEDVYEYSDGGLAQVNVTGPSPGVTIGTCGAVVARGFDGTANVASAHAVSADGSKVFFEAVPGSKCSDAKHAYVRINGSQTVDIGVYRFIAADPKGSKVLLEKRSGENTGLYLYDAETETIGFLPASEIATGASFNVSDDLSAVYFRIDGASNDRILYRYDVAGQRRLLVTVINQQDALSFFSVSPDGRYFYFDTTGIAGLPSGGRDQVFRYDSVEASVLCMSCASSFDSEPELNALFTTAEGGKMIASADGNYAFFDTPAALVSADVDGEVEPKSHVEGSEHGSSNYSVSSDVYEWRRDGLDGCLRPQGCLRLITTGAGGFLNILLGTTDSGRDVFFSTNESLVRSDNDTAGDIYDARIGGGGPEVALLPECEGDACSTPFSAPDVSTPSSAVFQGSGNVVSGKDAKARKKPAVKTRCKKTAKKKKCPRISKHKPGGKAGRVKHPLSKDKGRRTGRTGR